MTGWLSKNLWLKIIALVLAIIVWAYAREDLDKSPRYKQSDTPHQEAPAELPQK